MKLRERKNIIPKKENVDSEKKSIIKQNTEKLETKKKEKTVKNVVNTSEKKDYDQIVEKYYNRIENQGSLGGISKVYNDLKRKYKDIKKEDVKQYLSQQDEYTLHKPIIRKFARNKVVVSGIDDTWQMDLVDMRALKDENNNVTFIITIIDVFSKYGWGRMLPNKKGETILDAIKSVIEKSKRKPKKIQSDQGNEFFNIHCKNYFEKHKIKHYYTHSGLKASIVERFNKTLKDKMWRYFTMTGTKKYYDKFDEFFKSYNSSYHSSIKMSPKSVNKANSRQVFFNLYNYYKDEGDYQSNVKFSFFIGDYVRISKYKHIFSKGYESNWTSEVFQIDKILFHNSIPIYVLKDLLEEVIDGTFYAQEMQKVGINIREAIKNNEFVIESTLKTRVIKGQKEYFVKWKYYPESSNSWVKQKDWL